MVCERCMWKMVCDKVVFDKDGVCDKEVRTGEAEDGGGKDLKTRTLHNVLGNNDYKNMYPKMSWSIIIVIFFQTHIFGVYRGIPMFTPNALQSADLARADVPKHWILLDT